MIQFYKKHRRTDDEFLKAAALAGAFEQWNRKHPVPIYVPAPFRNLLPLSIDEIGPRMAAARRRAGDHVHGVECIRACLDQQLKRCKHPRHRSFCAGCPPRRASRYDEFGVTDSDIEFKPETFMTTVTVRSVFKEVSWKEAEAIAIMADPPNWDDAAPTFFKETVPIKRRSTGTYVPAAHPAPTRNGYPSTNANGHSSVQPLKYLLHERVEWAWSPALNGGIINVLEIAKPKKLGSAKSARSFIGRVLRELREEKYHVPRYEPSGSDQVLIAYKYKLKDCIQSKFVGGWEPEGLDRDGGSYKAAWSPQNGRTGILAIEAVKNINYSTKAAAELFPGMSAFLNLLAPSLTTMLMNHLTYYGPCSFLAFTRERAKSKGRGRRVNSKRRIP